MGQTTMMSNLHVPWFVYYLVGMMGGVALSNIVRTVATDMASRTKKRKRPGKE